MNIKEASKADESFNQVDITDSLIASDQPKSDKKPQKAQKGSTIFSSINRWTSSKSTQINLLKRFLQIS